jgi:alpha-glucosidase (family GH31 glycosyl hydrolase)
VATLEQSPPAPSSECFSISCNLKPSMPGTDDCFSKRWCQFGLLSSHSRLHGSGSPRVPWSIDEEACSVLSKFTRLKNRMEPYLTSESILGVVARGHPLMRPLFVEFPQDRTAWLVDQQYMLGSSLLVAPVFGQSEVEYYLPDAGASWTNILTGEAVVGGRWVKEEHDMMSLPVLLRPDSALVLGKEGHTVTDVITKRGFTVLVGRHVDQPILVKVALRSGQNLELSISPIGENGSVVGFKTTCSNGKVPYEVVVIGNGIGLDNLASRIVFEAKAGVCVATLEDE